jgi:hypothetical protein
MNNIFLWLHDQSKDLLIFSRIMNNKMSAQERKRKEGEEPHRNLRTRRRMSSQKGTISLAKRGKFKVGVVPADGLGRLLLKTVFWYLLNGVV